jgi:hypothetical protein
MVTTQEAIMMVVTMPLVVVTDWIGESSTNDSFRPTIMPSLCSRSLNPESGNLSE